MWLEVLAVVFGVFLALQADNWNKWRQERLEERDYLIRLYADIDASLWRARGAIDYMKSHARRANVVLSSLEQCQVDADNRLDFANGLFQLGNIVPPYLADSTITELRSTGKESLFQNSEIRNQLNKLLSTRKYYGSFFGIIVDRLQPHVVYVQSRVRYSIDGSNAGTQQITWEALEFDLEALCQDSRFYNAVSAGRTYSYDTVFWSETELTELEKLADLLRNELEKQGLQADELLEGS